jgi:hypothetical protein
VPLDVADPAAHRALLGELPLLLGEAARFYPSDAALASWTALLPHKDAAQLVYE